MASSIALPLREVILQADGSYQDSEKSGAVGPDGSRSFIRPNFGSAICARLNGNATRRKKMSAGKKSAAKKDESFSKEERAAMRERAKELKAAANKADSEKTLLAKISEMKQPDRGLCTKLHAIIKANAPNLVPKTWYGMPAYANADGKVVLFFRDTQKFKERYITLGFNEDANLDDGTMWPIAYALQKLTPADEKKIAALVKRAVRTTR